MKKVFLAVFTVLPLFLTAVASQHISPAYGQVVELVLVCYPVSSEIPPTTVTLTDQFGVEDVNLSLSEEFCAIAVKNGVTPPIAPFFWKQYIYDGTINPPTVKLTDQFGSEIVDIGKSEDLLVPGFVVGLGEPLVRHWKSYPAPGSIDPSPVTVAGALASEVLDPAPAVLLLVPTLKMVDGIVFGDLNDSHYRCYPVSGQFDPNPLIVQDQFGTHIIDPEPANLLCIPTIKELIPVGGEILGVDMTSLFVAGALTNVVWIIPVTGVMAAGVIGYLVKRYR